MRVVLAPRSAPLFFFVCLMAGCAVAAAGHSPAPVRPLLSRLLQDLPVGADQCVATAPYLVSDRRRALLGELSDADALGWARVPHVAAYVRCRYRGRREQVLWRVLIDGELDRETLPMHVLWEGERCEADRCDLPTASFDGEVLVLQSPDARWEGREPGAESELRLIAGRLPRLLEARVTSESVTLRTLEDDGVREQRQSDVRRDRVLSWDEVEVLAADQQIRRARSMTSGSERILEADAIDWSDGDRVASQLELRTARLARRPPSRRGPVVEELVLFATRAMDERAADARVLELSLRALIAAGHAEQALARVDAAVIEADYDAERMQAMRGLGWELAVRADHPSAPERLVAAGLAADAVDARALAPLLAEALDRDVAGPTQRSDVEAEVLRLRALAGGPVLVELPRPVVVPSLGLLPALVALLTDEPETTAIEVLGWMNVDVPVATVAVFAQGPRLTLLPGRALHAVHVGGPLEVLDAAAEALRSVGDGPFRLELRLGPSDAPSRIVRVEGVARRGRLSLTSVSATVAGWDWSRIARHLMTPFSDALETRFPTPELSWSGEDDELLSQVASELSMMHLAECRTGAGRVICTPRAGRYRDAILGAARALAVLPAD